MNDDLIERLKKWRSPAEFERMMRNWDGWRKYIKEGSGGSWPRDAFESLLDAFGQDASDSAEALAEIRAENERLKGANRKLHRRAQIAEAVNQSVEGILAGWKDVLKDRYAPHNQKWLLFSLALDDIVKRREKIASRSLGLLDGPK